MVQTGDWNWTQAEMDMKTSRQKLGEVIESVETGRVPGAYWQSRDIGGGEEEGMCGRLIKIGLETIWYLVSLCTRANQELWQNMLNSLGRYTKGRNKEPFKMAEGSLQLKHWSLPLHTILQAPLVTEL